MQLPQLLLDDFITLIWTAQLTLKAGELPLGDKLGVLLEKLLKLCFIGKERVWPTKRSADKFSAHGAFSKINKSNTVRQKGQSMCCARHSSFLYPSCHAAMPHGQQSAQETDQSPCNPVKRLLIWPETRGNEICG